MNKMNPEAKEKIVAALRSGKYKQGRGQLRKGDCYCVWGVICDVSGVGEWSEQPDVDGDMYYQHRSVVPSRAVMEWVFPNGPYGVTIEGTENSLMAHNDDNGATFEQLADAIEEQL